MFLERNGNDESGVVVSSYRVVLSVMMLDAGCWMLVAVLADALF